MTEAKGQSAERLIAQLASSVDPGEPVERLDAVNKLAAFIEQAPAAARRASRRRFWLVSGASAAAAVAIAAIGYHVGAQDEGDRAVAKLTLTQPGVSVRRADTSASEPALGAELSDKDELVTAAGARASLELPSGASVELSERSQLRLLGLHARSGRIDESALLRAGTVELSVPKLTGGRLRILTQDAEIAVIGTRFGVRVQQLAGGAVTCVVVHEGRVQASSARQQALLGAGARWASSGEQQDCWPAAASAREAARQPESDAFDPQQLPPEPPSSAQRPAPAQRRAPSSTLALENELFQRAVRARRDGHLLRARQLQREFLQTYPNSALAPKVRAEQLETDKAGR